MLLSIKYGFEVCEKEPLNQMGVLSSSLDEAEQWF